MWASTGSGRESSLGWEPAEAQGARQAHAQLSGAALAAAPLYAFSSPSRGVRGEQSADGKKAEGAGLSPPQL